MEGYDKLFRFIPLGPIKQILNQKSSPERVFVGESLGSQLINPVICFSWFYPRFSGRLYRSSPYNDNKYHGNPNDGPPQ